MTRLTAIRELIALEFATPEPFDRLQFAEYFFGLP